MYFIISYAWKEVLTIYFVEDNAMKWWKEMGMYRWMTTCLEVKLPEVIDSGMNWPPGYGYNTLLEEQLHTKIVGIYKTMVARTIVQWSMVSMVVNGFFPMVDTMIE
ncbi:hypothetical protein Taro_037965, partial [Colocasia esculenta]|nr:hypothetical protein [Colocasia esculenta]